MADDVIPSGSGSMEISCPLFITLNSHVQQLILLATWSCPTWVLHPSPFSDIFWAWCTCHVSCWWSRVAHRPSKLVKVVSSPSLGFVFNQQPMLQHGCFLVLLRAPADGGFDNTHTHIHIKMVDRIWQSLAMCKLNTASYPQNPSAAADDVIPSGSGSMGFSCPLSDYQSRPTAHTGSNLKLSNMGTSPFAFLWHLLSMMHMSCILLMISCCSPTLQICQSGLVSIPGLCFQSATNASTWLLTFSASSTCRRWIRQHAHTHSHQNGWQDMTKFGHVQTKHCFLPSKPLSYGRWCHSKWQWLYGIQLSTIRLSVKTNSSYW